MYSFDRHNHIHNIKFSFATFCAATLAVLTLLFGLLLSGPQASADSSTVVDIAVEISASCSIVASRESVSNTIIPGNSGAIGDTTIKAICNDPAGLAVYAAGYAKDTQGNNNLVNTVGGDDINIRTYVTASGTPPQSEWNMTINGITGTYAPTIVSEFDGAAHIIPQQYTKVAYRNAMTDIGTSATGAQFTAAFNAYIANDQASGTYTGKVKFLLIHPNLLDGSATQPDTIYIMQEVANWQDAITSGQTVTAMDERDGELYTVARLADGNIWMTKNLRTNIAKANITADNTDHPSAAFLTAISSKPTSSNSWCDDPTDSTCVDHVYYNTDNLGDYTADSAGFIYDEYGAYYNWYTATAGNGTLSTPVNASASGSICPSGWHLPSGTNTSVGAPWLWGGEYWGLNAGLNGLALEELTMNNFSPLTSTSGTLFKAAPNRFPYSGLYSINDAFNRDRNGYYWTSTAAQYNGVDNRAVSYMLYLGDSNSTTGFASTDRSYGLTIRCVADYARYLQDVASWGDSVALGEETTAADKRDGQVYVVKRLKMNAAGTETALWMSNLNLGARAISVNSLDSTNTHLASGVSAIPTATFNTWIKTTGNADYVNPEIIPLKSSVSCTVYEPDPDNPSTISCPEQDSYGNKYGTLYNYAAASAGTYTYASGAGTGNATSDLCPYGWRMPTGGQGQGEFSAFITAYSIPLNSELDNTSLQMIQDDLGFSFAGMFRYPPNGQGEQSQSWSSTRHSGNLMFYLYFGSMGLSYKQAGIWGGDRGAGFTLRCISQ